VPFTNPLRYVGSHSEVLAKYGCSATANFLSLVPLDLNQMDELYLAHRIIFAGVTTSFGAHMNAGFVAWPSQLPERELSIQEGSVAQQHFREMDAWAREAHGATQILEELLRLKSGDVYGRAKIYEAIVKGEAYAESGLSDPVLTEIMKQVLREQVKRAEHVGYPGLFDPSVNPTKK